MTWLVLQAAALLAMAWVPGAAATPLPLLGLWTAAFAAYGMGARAATTISPRALWGGAIAVRVGLLGAAPSLSEDVYRYMWDGWVARHGLNPFAFAPGEPDVAALRTDWWELINHPAVPTIYPPGAQTVFLALAAIAPAWLVFKAAWIAADLLVAWLVWKLVPAGTDDPGRGDAPHAGSSRRLAVFLYLWSPLLLVEVAWSGHFEPVGIAAMLGAVLLVRHRPAAGGALLGLGASIKFAPLAAVPALFRRHGAVAAGLALVVPALLYIPYAGAGARLFEGLSTYADIWEFNAGVYRLLALLPGPAELARWIGGAAVLGVALAAAARRWSLGRALFWTIGAGLLVSPTIHPWYVLWILPFAALRRSVPWLAFTGTVFLAYAGRDVYLSTGAWPEPPWLRVLIHAPLLALLAREWRAGGRSERLG